MIEIITSPTLEHLKELKSWLKKEHEKSEGFYSNWNIIEDNFNDNRLFCFIENEEVVGFICWYLYEIMVRFDIVEVKPNKRYLGFGKKMVEMGWEWFINEEVIVTEVECVYKSEPFWLRMGLKPYKKSPYDINQRMYLPLVEYQELDKVGDISLGNLKIELWEGEPWETRNKKSNWCWSIDTLRATKPIIFPANQNWRLKVTLNKKEIFDGKIKHRVDENVIHKAGFLFITQYNQLVELSPFCT